MLEGSGNYAPHIDQGLANTRRAERLSPSSQIAFAVVRRTPTTAAKRFHGLVRFDAPPARATTRL